ncbi:MAG: protein translocase subunit SecF [Acidimicrobiales bacterium]|nr:protein translocase subunit SecF [Acidimicrobiales bacterium]
MSDQTTPTPVEEPTQHGVLSRLYHGETDWNIVGRWKLWFAISGVMLLIGGTAVVTRGLNLGIDFTGGTVWEVPAGDATVAEVESAVSDLGYNDVQVQEFTQVSGEGDARSLRVEAESQTEPTAATTDALDTALADLRSAADSVRGGSADRLNGVGNQLDGIEGPFDDEIPAELTDLQDQLDGFADGLDAAEDQTAYVTEVADLMAADVDALAEAEQAHREEVGRSVSEALAELTGSDIDQVTVDTVGASWGQQISQKAETALVVFLIVVLLYITLRFEFRMAVATVAALLHDLLIVIGVYALFQFPVTPATVIAILTILGYSIYDTIVVFDRVDENTRLVGRKTKLTYTDVANRSMNQVLMRSLNTSITTLLPITAVLVIGSFLLGATTLQEFGLALFVGVVSGTYSSIFIATPLLALLKEREPRYREVRERIAEHRPATGDDDEGELAGAAAGPGGDGPLITPRPRKQGKKR